jgi:hypothetical protein
VPGCPLIQFARNPGILSPGKKQEPAYNDDIRLECAEGIYFFITRQEAVDF